MTAPTTTPYRTVVVPDTVWPDLTLWFGARGINLVAHVTGPDQMPYYGLNPRQARESNGRRRGQTTDLSDRELQVLILAAGGHSNGEIGGRLHLSLNTVKQHTSSLYKKLGAKDRAHAVFIACQRGILGGDS